MTNNYSFYNRIGRVEITDGTSILYTSSSGRQVHIHRIGVNKNMMRAFSDLDFTFSCRNVCDMTTVSSSAKVSILGLSRETIRFLTTVKPTGVERQEGIRVRVYASYENYGDNLIFDGDIARAIPSVPPENWINIEAFVGEYRKNDLVSIQIPGYIKRIDLLNTIAKVMKKELVLVKPRGKTISDEYQKRLMQELNGKIYGFGCNGTRRDLIIALNKFSRCRVYEDATHLYAAMPDVQRSIYGGLNGANINEYVSISEDSGMIGIPEIITGISPDGNGSTAQTLKIKTFINPNIRLWDSVYVKSIYMPSINGLYSVREMEYNGHFRGQDWYQTMVLVGGM